MVIFSWEGLKIEQQESLAKVLVDICKRDKIDMFDAAMQYIKEMDIDPEYFYSIAGRTIIEQIKVAVIEQRLLRPSVIKNEASSIAGFFQ